MVGAVWYVARTFSSPVIVAAFKPCRMLVLLSVVLQDTNNHHHPYTDSTTVLSDNMVGRSIADIYDRGDICYFTSKERTDTPRTARALTSKSLPEIQAGLPWLSR